MDGVGGVEDSSLVDGAAARVQELLERGSPKQQYDEFLDEDEDALGLDGKVVARKRPMTSALLNALVTCALVIVFTVLGMVFVAYVGSDSANQVRCEAKSPVPSTGILRQQPQVAFAYPSLGPQFATQIVPGLLGALPVFAIFGLLQVYLPFETGQQFLLVALSLVPSVLIIFIHVIDWSDLTAIKLNSNLSWLIGNQGWLAFFALLPASTAFWATIAIIVDSGAGTALEASWLTVACYGLCAVGLSPGQ